MHSFHMWIIDDTAKNVFQVQTSILFTRNKLLQFEIRRTFHYEMKVIHDRRIHRYRYTGTSNTTYKNIKSQSVICER